jgi:hypothetical protein
MNNKPNLLIYQDLVQPLDSAINELNEILKNYQNDTEYEGFINKGVFAYVMSLLEGSVSECVERYLFAFPEKLPKGKIDFEKYRGEILGADFGYELTALLIQDYLFEISYENSGQLLNKYCQLLDVTNLSPLFNKSLNEKKARRNALIHNNLKVDSKYIWTAKSDPRDKGKYLLIRPAYVIETIEAVLDILQKLQAELELKYGTYTILKAVKDVWTYLFQSPIMKFDDYWGVNGDMLYIKTEGIKKYYKSLSSSERTLLFYFLQNYNSGASEKLFKLHDLNMQVSNNHQMVFLVSVFDRFPLLLQNLKSIQPASFFKYVRD